MDFVAFKAPSHPALNGLASIINTEATIAKIPPCFLAAVVNRETGGQNIFQEGVPRGPGCGVGLAQITSGVDWDNPVKPTFEGYDLMDEADNLYVAGAFFLAPAIKSALRLQIADPVGFQQFGGGQVIYYAAAAYNAGWGAVISRFKAGKDPDGGTTDGYAHAVYEFYAAFVAESHT